MDRKEILRSIRKAGSKVAEAMSLVKEIGEKAGLSVSFKQVSTNVITLHKLAEMVSWKTGINENCSLNVLEATFELMEDRELTLELGGE